MRLTQDLSRSRVETKYGVAAGDVSALLHRIPADEREDYGVVTLYFDRPDASLAHRALADPLHCTKVRARRYEDGSPWVWFEVKTREGRWTRKSRLRLSREEASSLISGAADPGSVPSRAGSEEDADARSFLDEAAKGELVPVGAVYAFRRSFLLRRELVRITIDLDIAYHEAAAGSADMRGPLLWREPQPVLEVKHVGSVPTSCRRLLEGLRPSGYSKFRNLVRALRGADGNADRVDRL
jgi:hypothetical protein